MPLYEFFCPKCNKQLELIQNKFSDPHPTCSCVEDNPVTMVKKLSKNSFILKGHGWYRDGYSSAKK